MTFELFFYTLLFGLGCLLTFRKYHSNSFLLLIFVLTCYSIVVRTSGWDTDFYITYAPSLKTNPLYLFTKFYYIREIVYWLSTTMIYQVVRNEIVSFVLIDMFSFYLIIRAARRLELPEYSIILFILFFPALLGIQNIYRQYLAVTVLFYAMTMTSKRRFLLFVAAALIHNATSLFLPILFIANNVTKRNMFLFMSSAASILVLLPIVAGSKSEASHGIDLTVFYGLLILFILGFFIVSNRMILRRPDFNYFWILAYLSSIVLTGVILLAESQAERIAMISLQLSIPIVTSILERRYKEKVLARLIFIILACLPSYAFNSALEKLLTAANPLN